MKHYRAVEGNGQLLKQWIPSKTRLSFKVHDVHLEDTAEGNG